MFTHIMFDTYVGPKYIMIKKDEDRRDTNVWLSGSIK